MGKIQNKEFDVNMELNKTFYIVYSNNYTTFTYKSIQSYCKPPKSFGLFQRGTQQIKIH